MTMVETITQYVDPQTGYTISGTLTCTIDMSGSSITSMSYSGNFTFSGSGPVATVSMNYTMTMQPLAYSGTVTVNGQVFTY